MPRIHALPKLVLLLCALALVISPALAQPCPNPGDTFWQADSLPANPGSIPLGFSVIQGLCVGEACAVVFEMPPGMATQKITQVVCPFGATANGFTALVNVEIYDGVSFTGGFPNMGTKVFDLNQQTSTDLQVTSTALNILDTQQYNIVVGNDPNNRRYAVAFRMNLNPTGSCATGHPANFFTDNATTGFFCNPATTPTQTSLIDITGQGWRDAASATVTGVPLCPLFYSGVWAIRCCTQDASPPNPFQVTALTPLPVTSPGTVALQFNAPGGAGVPYIAAASLSTTPPIGTPFGDIPLAPDPLFQISIDPVLGPMFFTGFQGTISPAETAVGLINIPPGVSNFVFWVAFVVIPPAPNAWGISDALSIPVQ